MKTEIETLGENKEGFHIEALRHLNQETNKREEQKKVDGVQVRKIRREIVNVAKIKNEKGSITLTNLLGLAGFNSNIRGGQLLKRQQLRSPF